MSLVSWSAQSSLPRCVYTKVTATSSDRQLLSLQFSDFDNSRHVVILKFCHMRPATYRLRLSNANETSLCTRICSLYQTPTWLQGFLASMRCTPVIRAAYLPLQPQWHAMCLHRRMTTRCSSTMKGAEEASRWIVGALDARASRWVLQAANAPIIGPDH